ncbi:restriction endonuclease subunit S [Paraclostridium bifermentans]|uniref:restriction endonuclease subunit S n=1 Tax=Paraclostridium bifermentans TaxID=1490 RepID=UPI0024B8E7B3|nr:restriction endonuclease subunit S [Paraclostridium bifermentans]
MVELKSICTEIKDGDWIESKDQSSEGIRLVQTGNIGIGKYLNKDDRAKFVTEETFSSLKCTEIFEGDILISRLPTPVGRACVFPNIQSRAITAVDCTILRVNKELCIPKYFVYYTMSSMYLNQIDRFVAGTTRLRISRKNLEGIKIFLPEISLQNKIVEVLDKAQALIDKRKEQIEALDELVKSRFIEMFGDPIRNNMNWDIKKVGEISFVTKLAGFEYTQYINYQDEGEVIVVKGLNVKEKKLRLENVSYIDKETSDLLPRSQLKKNDLVMTYVGINIGDVAIVDENNRYHLAPNVAKISLLDDNNINPVFMVNLLYMSRILFSSGATNTAKQALNMARIRDIDIMIPPLELQKEFAIFYEQVDKLKFEMETSLKELEYNFNSLMQKAFKGELFN